MGDGSQRAMTGAVLGLKKVLGKMSEPWASLPEPAAMFEGQL